MIECCNILSSTISVVGKWLHSSVCSILNLGVEQFVAFCVALRCSVSKVHGLMCCIVLQCVDSSWRFDYGWIKFVHSSNLLVRTPTVNPSGQNEPTKRFKTNHEFVPQDFFGNRGIEKNLTAQILILSNNCSSRHPILFYLNLWILAGITNRQRGSKQTMNLYHRIFLKIWHWKNLYHADFYFEYQLFVPTPDLVLFKSWWSYF